MPESGRELFGFGHSSMGCIHRVTSSHLVYIHQDLPDCLGILYAQTFPSSQEKRRTSPKEGLPINAMHKPRHTAILRGQPTKRYNKYRVPSFPRYIYHSKMNLGDRG